SESQERALTARFRQSAVHQRDTENALRRNAQSAGWNRLSIKWIKKTAVEAEKSRRNCVLL
ncbi:MAG: hypothetical protein IKP01_04800, partial [Bacteroidales bacterium]|nr:hypothetical protein [Bacteroidales bacterium]